MPHYRSRGPYRKNYYNTWTIPRGWGPIYVYNPYLQYEDPYFHYHRRMLRPRFYRW